MAIRQLIAEIGGYAPEDIHPDALFGEDLGFDSLLQVRLITRLRAEYPHVENVSVLELLPVITRVDDLLRFVTDRVVGARVA